MTRRSRSLLFGAIGAVALAGAVVAEPPLRYLAIVIALVVLVGAASVGGVAGRAADTLGTFHDRPVHVRVWGEALPGGSGEGFQLVRLRTLGAGLHLLLRSRGGDGVAHELKVAQPQGIAIDAAAGRATIREARYVQWRRQRLPRSRAAGAPPALELELLLVRDGGEALPREAAGPGPAA